LGAGVMRNWVSAKESKWKRALKYLSGTYVLLLAATFVARILLYLFQGADRTELGCYLRGGLITKVDCEGFIGAEIIEFVFDIPSLMIFAPLIPIMIFIWQQFTLSSLLFCYFVWAFGCLSFICFGL
jgi:hypothetical protein